MKHFKDELSSFFCLADIILLAVFILLGAVSLSLLKYNASPGDTVLISIDGAQYGSYPLSEDRNLSIDSEYGHNLVCISKGTVSVIESDCHNHDCERFGAISMPAQSIMCLPHHLLIRIIGETDIDAVIY